MLHRLFRGNPPYHLSVSPLNDETTVVEVVGTVGELFDYDFRYAREIRYVIFPDNSILHTINTQTFYRLSNLQSIILPPSLRYIHSLAFAHTFCRRIVLPESLLYIGEKAFYYVGHLMTRINLPSGVCHIHDLAFAETLNEALVVPPQVKTIGFQIFGRHKIGDQIVQILSQPTCELQRLNLSKDMENLSPENRTMMIADLTNVMISNKTLTELQLRQNNLTETHATMLVVKLPQCPSLEVLDLFQNNIHASNQFLSQ